MLNGGHYAQIWVCTLAVDIGKKWRSICAMSAPSQLDEAHAHELFSVECFNRAWSFMEKPQRTPEEDEQMLLLSHTALWHWTQRKDCAQRNLSIGYWHLARIYALLGRAEDALRYGESCLRHSQNEPCFYLGYAHESLARAAMVGGDSQRADRHLSEARRLAALIPDADERSMLEKDLETIK